MQLPSFFEGGFCVQQPKSEIPIAVAVAALFFSFVGKFSGLQGDPPDHTCSDQENSETGEEEADKEHW
ncbi:hypothetical protein [uncultured Tateyamaria sp.]|uniref:hypothetical protein n=1 Tax=uncultured Tateyamaria sp. TaxID=455651 RepID=UPI0026255248|nr:hypothetical protein [uncultured Tateyamaria sp.]